MKIVPFLILACFTLSSCEETIRGNGNITKEERSVADFSGLSTSGLFEIVLAKGEPRLVITTDENLHEHIETIVESGTLTISTNNKYLDAKEMQITVYYQNIKSLDLSGATELRSAEPIVSDELDLDISGAADIDLIIDVQRFEIDLSGAAELNLAGRAEVCEFDLSGASDVKASELTAQNATIDISGGSQLELHVERQLNVSISGAGEVKYTGDPKVKKEINGAGVLTKK